MGFGFRGSGSGDCGGGGWGALAGGGRGSGLIGASGGLGVGRAVGCGNRGVSFTSHTEPREREGAARRVGGSSKVRRTQDRGALDAMGALARQGVWEQREQKQARTHERMSGCRAREQRDGFIDEHRFGRYPEMRTVSEVDHMNSGLGERQTKGQCKAVADGGEYGRTGGKRIRKAARNCIGHGWWSGSDAAEWCSTNASEGRKDGRNGLQRHKTSAEPGVLSKHGQEADGSGAGF